MTGSSPGIPDRCFTWARIFYRTLGQDDNRRGRSDVVGIRKKKPLVPILIGILMIAAGVISMVKGMGLHIVLFPLGALSEALGLYLFVRRIQLPPANPK